MGITNLDEIQARRRNLADQALLIGREIEAGRATAPFQDSLAQLAGEPNLPVRATVISDSPEHAQALLSEVMGGDYKVCKVVVPTRLGYSEVLLQERGFLLDTGSGAKEFDDVALFINAVEQSRTLQTEGDSGLEPLRLKLKAPAHLSGLCLLVPHSLDALVRRPALLSTLADQTDWVFLAGSAGSRVSPEQRQTIQLVLEHVTGLQHVMVPDHGTPPSTNPDEWWKNWKVTLSLGLVRTGTELLKNRLSLLTAPESELRRYLVENRLGRQLEMNLSLMDEEIQQAQRQITTRLNLAKEGLEPGAKSGDTRKTTEAVRSRLAEEADSLVRAVDREAKAALAPDGEVCRRLQAGAAAITSDDIDQTTGEVTIKLTLAEAVNHRLTDLLAEVAHQRLAADLQQFREGLECSVRDAEQALESATGMRHKLAFSLPDEAEVRILLGSVARPELKYRGEMPRPTLGSRFNAARQAIMGLMILGTMVGGAAALAGGNSGSARTLLTSLMLPLLVIGFLWTYVSFRKTERLTLEKEVEKLHEGVYFELRRTAQELIREQQGAISQHVQKSLRAIQQQIEAAFAQVEQQRARDAEQQRKRAADQQRSLEQRVTRLREVGRQLAALQGKLADARKLQQAWLGDWIHRFNQGKV
jgi:hypothetical protein